MVGTTTRRPRRATLLLSTAIATVVAALASPAGAGERHERRPFAIDVARERGIDLHAQTWSADAVDYDGDGWQDLFVVRHRFQPTQLYRNSGGHFSPVAAASFPISDKFEPDRHDCAWADVNGDERLDVFCSVGGKRGHGTKANELWIQAADGSFADQAEQWGVVDSYGRGRFVTFIDVNHDPWPDLYVANYYPRPDGQPTPNVLFMNEAGEGFRRATELGLESDLGGTSVQAADLDGDGWQDLVVCGQTGLRIFRNESGAAFSDVTAGLGAGGLRCVFALADDFDRDGKLDLVVLRHGGLQLRLQRGGRFARPAFSRQITNGRSLAAGRFNADRYPDLYVLTGSESVQNGDRLLVSIRSGRAFKRKRAPSTRFGIADQVIAIDSDRDKRVEFLALNGRGHAHGPVQLIAPRGR